MIVEFEYFYICLSLINNFFICFIWIQVAYHSIIIIDSAIKKQENKKKDATSIQLRTNLTALDYLWAISCLLKKSIANFIVKIKKENK